MFDDLTLLLAGDAVSLARWCNTVLRRLEPFTPAPEQVGYAPLVEQDDTLDEQWAKMRRLGLVKE
jgi:hypothetical protein